MVIDMLNMTKVRRAAAAREVEWAYERYSIPHICWRRMAIEPAHSYVRQKEGARLIPYATHGLAVVYGFIYLEMNGISGKQRIWSRQITTHCAQTLLAVTKSAAVMYATAES